MSTSSSQTVKPDKDAITAQHKYKKQLRRLTLFRLERLHKTTFADTPYYMEIPRTYHRSAMERRLFYWYAWKKRPIYPKDTVQYREFARKAKEVLNEEYVTRFEDQLSVSKKELQHRILFTKANIKKMSKKEVEAYLLALGYLFEDSVTLNEKKRCLWEFFNHRASDIPQQRGQENKRKLIRRNRYKIDNEYFLTDLIMMYPAMGWREFQEAFGEIMPTIRKQSFYNARSKLKKEGVPLPTLKSGPKISRERIGDEWEGIDVLNPIEPKAPKLPDEDFTLD